MNKQKQCNDLNQKRYNALRKIKDDLELYLDKQVTKDVHIILPANISEEFLIANTPPELSESRWLAGSYYIIHTIFQRSSEKRNHKGKSNTYVPLYSKILKAICGDTYNVFIRHLINLSIIKCDGEYSKSKHESFGFCLMNEYRAQPLKHETIEYKNIKKAILQYRAKRLIELKIKIKPIAHLARWSVDSKLKIDKESALEYMDSYKIRMLKEINRRNLLPKFQETETSFVNTKFYRARHQIETWGNGPTLIVDDSGGRLYTGITGLMSPLRNFLTYDGKPLVSFDIKNSQPLHLLILLTKHFWKQGKEGLTMNRLNKDLLKYLNKMNSKDNTRLLNMFLNSDESLGGTESQFTDFRFLVKNGKLYEFISKKLYDEFQQNKNNKYAGKFITRNKTKKEVLKLMYFNPKEKYSGSHDTFKAFALLFPEVAMMMSMLKKRDYKDFPILLQKLEAQILLHDVCRRVYDKNPDIPLFTVHDSIITTLEYEHDLKRILEETYTEIFGFTPAFTREELASFNADGDKLKYIKSKIDQAEMEIISEDESISELSSLKQCENWNIIQELEDLQNPKKTERINIVHGMGTVYFPVLPDDITSFPLIKRKLKK